MNQEITLKHEFVDFIPEELKERTTHISVCFATASHLCVRGCGNKVVTPLRPMDWKLIFDGKTVSLDPSIGNWSFACKSHYWIRNNKVTWARRWSQREIEADRRRDRIAKQGYFETSNSTINEVAETDLEAVENLKTRSGFWHALKRWWS